MAKIGKLILDKSEWQNKQIVSEQWINKSLQTFSKLPDNKGYSYGWWTNDKVGYYEAAGRGRQTISVIPSKNMIVTMLGGEFDAGTIGKYIFQSIQSSKAAALPPSQEQVLTNDTVLNLLNGQTIVFEKNITEIDSLQFSFSSKTNGTVIFYRDHKHRFRFTTSCCSTGNMQKRK